MPKNNNKKKKSEIKINNFSWPELISYLWLATEQTFPRLIVHPNSEQQSLWSLETWILLSSNLFAECPLEHGKFKGCLKLLKKMMITWTLFLKSEYRNQLEEQDCHGAKLNIIYEDISTRNSPSEWEVVSPSFPVLSLRWLFNNMPLLEVISPMIHIMRFPGLYSCSYGTDPLLKEWLSPNEHLYAVCTYTHNV